MDWLLRWLASRQVRIGEVRNIAKSRQFGGPGRLHEMYDWHASRLGDVAKGVAGTFATVLTTTLFALMKKEVKVHVGTLDVILFAIALAATAMYAGYLAWRLARLPAEYAESLRLFAQEASQQDPPFPEKPWS